MTDTPRLVIFDCDGVLVDTEPTTDAIIAEDLATRGLPLDPKEIHQLFAGGTMKGALETAQAMGADLPGDWLDVIYGRIFARLAKGVPVIDGVFPFLDSLAARGCAIAIASNGPMAKMEITLKPSGLWDHFAGRIYSGHDYAPKPQPAMIVHAMRVAGAAPHETIFIDDSPGGAKAGIAAGVRTFGFDPSGGFERLQGLELIRVQSFPVIATQIGLEM